MGGGEYLASGAVDTTYHGGAHATGIFPFGFVLVGLFFVCFILIVFATPNYYPDYWYDYDYAHGGHGRRGHGDHEGEYVEEEYVTADGRRVRRRRLRHFDDAHHYHVGAAEYDGEGGDEYGPAPSRNDTWNDYDEAPPPGNGDGRNYGVLKLRNQQAQRGGDDDADDADYSSIRSEDFDV